MMSNFNFLRPLCAALILLSICGTAVAQSGGGDGGGDTGGGPNDPPYTDPWAGYSFSGHGYIYVDSNFPPDRFGFVIGTLGFIQARNFSFLTSPYGVSVAPYSHLTSRISHIKSVPILAGSDAYTTLNGDINLHDQSPWFSQTFMAAVFVHEADHQRYGAHTCGRGDVDVNGPYGVGMMYAAKLYWNGNLDAAERSHAFSFAGNGIFQQLCGNTTSINIVSDALFNNRFPVRPTPPPESDPCLRPPQPGRPRPSCR